MLFLCFYGTLFQCFIKDHSTNLYLINILKILNLKRSNFVKHVTLQEHFIKKHSINSGLNDILITFCESWFDNVIPMFLWDIVAMFYWEHCNVCYLNNIPKTSSTCYSENVLVLLTCHITRTFYKKHSIISGLNNILKTFCER